jgi:glycerol uptake facilitator-like aquaporin
MTSVLLIILGATDEACARVRAIAIGAVDVNLISIPVTNTSVNPA